MRKIVYVLVSGLLLLGASAAPAVAQSDPAEISFWESVRESRIPSELEAYLKAYPDGKFAPLAKIRLDRLKSDVTDNAKINSLPESKSAPQAEQEPPPVIVAWQEKTIAVTLGGSGKQGMLGVHISSATSFKGIGGRDGKDGAVILGVIPGSAAESAGLRSGDIILKFDTHPVVVHADLPGFASKTPPGKKIDIVITRPDVDDAIRQYRALADKGAANAAINLGFLYRAKGDRKNGFEWSLKAAEQGHQISMFNVAEAYEHGSGVAKNRAEAISWYRKAAATGNAVAIKRLSALGVDFQPSSAANPHAASAHVNRGTAYAQKGQYDLAIAEYNEALRLDPNHFEAYINRGSVYFRTNDYDRALADYNEAIRLKPTHALARAGRGTAYGGKREYDRAIDDFTEAIRLDPNPSAYHNRGFAYYNKKDYDRAIANFSEAIRLDASSADAYKLRASAYENIGRKTDAISDYRKALLLDPADKYAMEGLKRLGAKPF